MMSVGASPQGDNMDPGSVTLRILGGCFLARSDLAHPSKVAFRISGKMLPLVQPLKDTNCQLRTTPLTNPAVPSPQRSKVQCPPATTSHVDFGRRLEKRPEAQEKKALHLVYGPQTVFQQWVSLSLSLWYVVFLGGFQLSDTVQSHTIRIGLVAGSVVISQVAIKQGWRGNFREQDFKEPSCAGSPHGPVTRAGLYTTKTASLQWGKPRVSPFGGCPNTTKNSTDFGRSLFLLGNLCGKGAPPARQRAAAPGPAAMVADAWKGDSAHPAEGSGQ